MWVSKKEWEALKERVADLEKQVSSFEEIAHDWKLVKIKTELNYEFCKSVAHKEGTSFLSYQQLNSPTADSSKKVRMLFEQIRKLS